MRDSVRQTVPSGQQAHTNGMYLDFGKEKKVSLKGLDDRAIEQQVTDIVKS